MFWKIVVFGGFFFCLFVLGFYGLASLAQVQDSTDGWQKIKRGVGGAFWIGFVIYCIIKLLT